MSENTSDSKRLAKNTAMLYVRTLITMIIGLLTSRILLDSLGIENYGIYNVVGGFIAMFSVITGTLTATTQRYLNFELGKVNGNPQKVFGACMCIHFGLAILMLLLFETFGLWFLNTQLNIPSERFEAASWCFQISVITSILGLFSTPYIGVIIAHERMKAFAYISLQDAIAKLLICYLLYISTIDKLVLYSMLFAVVMIWDQCLYVWYCHKHFSEAHISIVKDNALYKSMFNFAGMNFIGALAHILSTQGVNIILNIFFGVVVNAARGIAIQVQSAISRFVNDFMSALSPQITKEYAANNKEKSMELCFRGAKFSFYLMTILALPVIVRAPEILQLWLKVYPDYSIEFVRLTLATSMLGVLSTSLITEILATGNLTSTTWWIGGTRLLILPLVYIAFKFGGSPIYAYYIVLVMDTLLLFVRLAILDSITGMTFMKMYIKNVFPQITAVILLSSILVFGMHYVLPVSVAGLLVFALLSVICTGVIIVALGLTQSERVVILGYVKNKFKKI